MRSRYTIFQNNQPYFITMTIVNWVSLFTNQAMFDIVISTFKFLVKNNDLKIYAYVIMENHIHAICSSENLSNLIRRYKSFTAREIIDKLKNENKFYILKQLEFGKKSYKKDQQYQVWQEGFHPKLIQSNEMMIQKIEYIHNNPVKRGYVGKPEYWIHSSSGNYAGDTETVLDVELFEG